MAMRMSDSCRLMLLLVCGHVGCVSAEKSDGAMREKFVFVYLHLRPLKI